MAVVGFRHGGGVGLEERKVRKRSEKSGERKDGSAVEMAVD